MAPKPKKAKKTKAELEEERLAREEEERKAKILEEKRLAEEKEKKRLEELRIQAEQHEFRKQELERLKNEYDSYNDDIKSRKYQLDAEEKKEVRDYICSSFFIIRQLLKFLIQGGSNGMATIYKSERRA